MIVDQSAVGRWPCWCGSLAHRLCWRTSRFGLSRCQSCGCYRIDPPPLTSDQDCEQFYTEYYQAPRQHAQPAAPDADRSSRFWNVAALQPQLLWPGNAALDIGCGEGQLCAELMRHGWRTVVGVDVAKTRIHRARELHPHVRFYDVPLAETDLAPGTFDLIVLDNVIEHLPDPLAAIRELHRYLAPDGRLVIITPNMESGHYRLLRRRWTPELAPHAHIYLFTPSALGRLLSDAGLDVGVTSSFHQAGLPVSALLSRAARGDVKGAVWRAVQDMGGVYGHLIGAGPMLYTISTPVHSVDSMSEPLRGERATVTEEAVRA
jgi:SAM-dependent methyltransferase